MDQIVSMMVVMALAGAQTGIGPSEHELKTHTLSPVEGQNGSVSALFWLRCRPETLPPPVKQIVLN